MIKIEYRPDTYLDILEMNADMRRDLESDMSRVVTGIASTIDTTCIDKLVITDTFAEDVLAFQSQHHYEYTGITDNSIGRAQGKTLVDKETGRYTIFIDSNFGVALVNDDIIDVFLQAIPDQKESIFLQRAASRNLVAHEFMHAEFDSCHMKPQFGTSHEERLKSIAWLLYDEYNACRNAAAIEPMPFISDTEKGILDIEKIIIAERRKYNFRDIDLTNFRLQFLEYTKMALIFLVSALGDSEGASKEIPDYPNCMINNISVNIADGLHTMSESIDIGNFEEPLEEVARTVRLYHELFHVFISDTPQGEYWDIPVRP